MKEDRVLITEDYSSRMRTSECMPIYKRPTLLQKGLKAVETYSRLTCGSAVDVRIAITETAILQGERWSKVVTEMAPLGLCSCNRPPYPQPQEGPSLVAINNAPRLHSNCWMPV